MRPSTAREVALQVLGRVERDAAFANLALDAACSDAGLDPRDAALATELVYGCLRRRAALDAALAPWVRSGWASLDPEVRDLLRLGAYQILHTRIPPHAAVAETVATAKQAGLFRVAGLVNAVLRRVVEHGAPAPPDPTLAPQAWIEQEGSLPPWLAEKLLRRLGPEEAMRFVEASHRPAPASLRTNLRRISRDELLQRLHREIPQATISESEASPAGLLVEGGGSLPRLPSFREGLFSLQDEAAQLVGLLLGPVEGLRVLDTCAAPGGKACHLSERGAREVVAGDRNARKVRRIGEEAQRLGLDQAPGAVVPVVADATEPLEGGPYDAVLVDAPCSALGTLRRHPELRYRREAADVERMVEVQAKILDRAAEAVAPGGILVYAVCTFTVDEGPGQIEAFLRRHGDRFEPAPLDAPLVGMVEGWKLETWPHRHAMDAFFAARLRRRDG
jgi:16S rRNA (cytosine967-C5)-methyltransferase